VIVLVSLVVFVVYTACFIVVSIATKGIGIIFAQFLVYPIMFVTWIIWEQAQTAIVADEMGGPAALVRAWDLVRDNIPAFIILGVLVYFAQAIVSSILFIPIFMPLWGVMFSSTITETVPDMKILWVSMLCVLAITPVYAFVMGIFKTYSRSVFVIIYRRLTRDSEARQELLQALGSKEIK
jgi:signal transduction histidine kinase